MFPGRKKFFFFCSPRGKVTASHEGSLPLRVPSSGCTAGWIRANLHPSLDSKVAATSAVPSIDPRGLVVSLAACVPAFLAFWLVYRHGTLQMLAAFGSRHQSHQSSGGYVGRSQWSWVAPPPSKVGLYWSLWLVVLRHICAWAPLDWVGCMHTGEAPVTTAMEFLCFLDPEMAPDRSKLDWQIRRFFFNFAGTVGATHRGCPSSCRIGWQINSPFSSGSGWFWGFWGFWGLAVCRGICDANLCLRFLRSCVSTFLPLVLRFWGLPGTRGIIILLRESPSKWQHPSQALESQNFSTELLPSPAKVQDALLGVQAPAE